LQGLDDADHEASINALINLHVKSTSPVQVLSNLREQRHNINYKGFIPSITDLEDVISMKKTLWKPILEEVKRRLSQS